MPETSQQDRDNEEIMVHVITYRKTGHKPRILELGDRICPLPYWIDPSHVITELQGDGSRVYTITYLCRFHGGKTSSSGCLIYIKTEKLLNRP